MLDLGILEEVLRPLLWGGWPLPGKHRHGHGAWGKRREMVRDRATGVATVRRGRGRVGHGWATEQHRAADVTF